MLLTERITYSITFFYTVPPLKSLFYSMKIVNKNTFNHSIPLKDMRVPKNAAETTKGVDSG